MAGFLVEDEDPETSIPGSSSLSGIGFINGVRCMLLVDDSGINAGASTAKSVEKALGVLAIAQKQKLPFVKPLKVSTLILSKNREKLPSTGPKSISWSKMLSVVNGNLAQFR